MPVRRPFRIDAGWRCLSCLGAVQVGHLCALEDGEFSLRLGEHAPRRASSAWRSLQSAARWPPDPGTRRLREPWSAAASVQRRQQPPGNASCFRQDRRCLGPGRITDRTACYTTYAHQCLLPGHVRGLGRRLAAVALALQHVALLRQNRSECAPHSRSRAWCSPSPPCRQPRSRSSMPASCLRWFAAADEPTELNARRTPAVRWWWAPTGWCTTPTQMR